MEDIIDTIKKVKEVLNNSDRWTQGALARTAEGKQVLSSAKSATCYCLVGAISKVVDNYPVFNTTLYHKTLDSLRNYLGKHPEHWNDEKGRTYEEVREMLTQFIDKMENENGME